MALFDEKLDKFKSTALEQGFGEDEVNSFLESPEVKKVMEFKTQSRLPQVGAVAGEQYVMPDSGFSGFNEAPLSTGGESVLPKKFAINTRFGARSGADVFSGGINYGTDIDTPMGTQINAPPGKWVAKESFGKAPNNGYIGNGTNQGYGNSVLLQNAKTGEQIRFSHLSPGVDVKPGQIIEGGQSLGRTGLSGNTSGSHLDAEYYDSSGQIRDIFKSKYRNLFG